ncbi:unnamed protein product, partial [Tilletia controversa]
MRFQGTALLTAAATLLASTHLVQAAPSSLHQQQGRADTIAHSSGEIHLLRRRAGRKDGVPLHEHLNGERTRLRNKYKGHKARVAAREAASEQGQTLESRDGSTNFGVQTNTLYYAAVTVGTPAKSYPVGIDSGSSDLWISGQNWNGDSVSSSFKRNGNPFTIKYQDGTSVTGYQGLDTVTFAGYTATTALSVGTQLSQGAAPAPADGIFGFGWPTLATGNEDPFWISSGANVFSMYLASSDDFRNSYAYGGVINLGQPNSSLYTGSINYVPITRKVYWTVELQAFGVGGTQLQLYQDQPAVIDSGTSLIGAPDRIVSNFYASIPNARNVSGSEGFYEYPCSDSNLGIQMTFGGQAYSIPDANFVFDQGTDENYCVGALFGNGEDGTGADQQFIVGDSFMRGVYTVFDGPKASVGFAQLSSSAPTTGPDFVASGSHGSNSNGGSGSGNSGSGSGGGIFGGIFGGAQSSVPAPRSMLNGEPEPLRALLARLQEERSRVHLKYRSVSSASRTGGTTSRRRRSSKASETPITAAAANSTTSVTLATQGRSVLFAPTTVGTPATTFLLAVDTTASDLWILTDVWGDDPNDPALLAETYGPNATRSPADLPTPPSSSFRSTNHTFSSAAVNGASIWQGFQGTDIVKFAGRRLDDAAINIDTDS